MIQRAIDTQVSLYMLGFGPKGKLAEDVMMRMAAQTGGQYYHANNKKDQTPCLDEGPCTSSEV
ncbi:MAG: hypothetical protein HC850_16160 [Rhodomicrobium sp.]|nr:hypothetical protein [Rhodomicrobium sp.]